MSSFLANSYFSVEVNGNVKRCLTGGSPFPMAFVPPFIRVDFFLSHVVSFPNEENPGVFQSMIQAISEKSVVTLSDASLESMDEARQIEGEALTAMGVPESEHSQIIDTIAAETAVMIASAGSPPSPIPGFKPIPISAMSISVQMYQVFQFHSLADMQTATMDDVSQSNNRMPASRSSIDMLERGREFGFEDATCTICLDDIADNMEFLRMPCKHVFHVDCIETWLSQSHFCPTCRYEMPVD